MLKIDPLNISLLDPSRKRLGTLLPVRSLDIFDGDGNLHMQGVYSPAIFGAVGSPERMTRHSFIDMKTEILHPKFYKELTRSKNLYSGIMAGTTYAEWDTQLKDFVKSDIIEGDTGYAFFIKHLPDIKFVKNNSLQRGMRVDFFEKYRDNALYRYMPVLPAGLRELTYDDSGRPVEDEISPLYRKLLRKSNTLNESKTSANDPTFNQVRYSLQQTAYEIFEMLENLLEGKRGRLKGELASRAVHYGTRNVITAMDPSPTSLTTDDSIGTDTVLVGLHQFLKGTALRSIYDIRNGPMKNILTAMPGDVPVINPQTLKQVMITPNVKTRDKWSSAEGIEGLLNGYANTKSRNNPVTIQGHYVKLVVDNGKEVKLFDSIDDVGESDKDLVRPITWTELYYLSVYHRKETYGTATRYPVTLLGSVFPAHFKLKITSNDSRRTLITDDPTVSDTSLTCWPNNQNPEYFDSMSIHPNKLQETGGD